MNYSATETHIFRPDEETNLLVYTWLPDREIKAVFIGLHGGLAHAGDWVTPALYFKEKGIATYAFDFRWHGTYSKLNPGGMVYFHTNSYDQNVKDVHKFYGWVKDRHPDKPLFIISHSNGSLLALQYGLTMAKDSDIKGFIVSSPWLKNKVRVPQIMQSLAKLIAKVHPTFTISPPPVTDKLTHDEAITARHYKDEKEGLRGKKVTAKLGVESQKAQQWVLDHIDKWVGFPVFAVIAGQDVLADPDVSKQALRKIPQKLLTMIIHENNYHENFNEINRNETFECIWDWVQPSNVKTKNRHMDSEPLII